MDAKYENILVLKNSFFIGSLIVISILLLAICILFH